MEGWQVRQTPGTAQRQKDPNKTDAGSREDRRCRQTGEDAGADWRKESTGPVRETGTGGS